MAKVDVSSTVADLAIEQTSVMEWLIAAGHQPVHSYRPDSETVRESCIDDIDRCDLYVLILGHRYGFQPAEGPGTNGVYGFDHMSVAEWLTLENEQFVPRAVPYAVDLSASHERIHNWSLEMVNAKQAYQHPYLLRHLAVHLEENQRADIFAELMFDVRWLKAKVLNAGVHSLIADWHSCPIDNRHGFCQRFFGIVCLPLNEMCGSFTLNSWAD